MELLLGIALGIVTISAALLFFAANKRHFLVQIEASWLQENQRILVQLLSHDIREAGYRVCARNHNTLDNTVNN